ncbi:DciA family protein [Croceicoccus sp. F390]|uniref:DciA family protein n=1 Tax=Croceicoccus esteveae TaxID=3075597 RepID=A0ABU2ZDU1_9SPHN|nr:DciA family protein [Croceicoccus sp. F390]MDT0574768.1 DciA family protein [Croceicoccus sp. F390]
MKSDSSMPPEHKGPSAPRRAAKPAAIGETRGRARGGSAQRIADLMPDIGRTAFRKFGFVQSSVVTRWTEIVGDRHASISAPESIRFAAGQKADGVLNLVVLPAHAPMMQHVCPELIERVNRFFGYRAIIRIKMRQGAIQPRASVADTKPDRIRASQGAKISAEMGDCLRDVADPELRKVLESLAQSMCNAASNDRDKDDA